MARILPVATPSRPADGATDGAGWADDSCPLGAAGTAGATPFIVLTGYHVSRGLRPARARAERDMPADRRLHRRPRSADHPRPPKAPSHAPRTSAGGCGGTGRGTGRFDLRRRALRAQGRASGLGRGARYWRRLGGRVASAGGSLH